MTGDQIIIPAIIPDTAEQVYRELDTMPWLYEVHIDVVDGDFVQNVSWPYEPLGTPAEISAVLEQYSVEVDLMVSRPLPAAKAWVESGAERLVFHAETISVDDFTDFTNRFPEVSVGVSILNDTPWSVIEPFISLADFVQLMGIAIIGAQGADFDERVLERIAMVQATDLAIPISVDGSVNHDSIPILRQAGADRYVVGSALLQAEDREQQYQYLDALARPQTVA